MTDTQVVIAAAKMVGREVFVDDDGFGNKDIGYYTTHNKVGHQLLMLAVLRRGNGELFYANGQARFSFGQHLHSKWVLEADLPLAVINAAAKEVEG